MKKDDLSFKIRNQIIKLTEISIKGVINWRKTKGGFADDYHKSPKQTFMQTCEGLEIILLPLLSIQDHPAFKEIEKPAIKKIIKGDIEYLIKTISKNNYEFFPGSPYYISGKRHVIAKNSIDALAFYTNVLVHLLALANNKNYLIDGIGIIFLKEHLNKCISAIINFCKSDGWSFFADKTEVPDEYCTWSVLETIADLKEYYPEGYKSIKDSSILKKTEDWLIGRTKNGLIKDIQDFVSSIHDEIDIENPVIISRAKCFYDVSHVLSGLALLESPGDSKLGHNIHYLILRKDIMLEKEFVTQYPSGNEVEDYTLAPMLLKCLSYIFQTHFLINSNTNKVEQGLGILSGQRDQVLLSIYSHIIKNKRHFEKNNGEFTGFFSDSKIDQFDSESFKTDIYYSERVIESLVAYYEYLNDKEVAHTFKDEEIDPLLSKQVGFPLKKKHNLKTKKERINNKFAKLPALDLYSDHLRLKYGNVFKDKIILCVQHFLKDLPPFIDYLVRLGADYRNIYLLQKTYDYPEGDDIYNYLIDQGCHIEKLSSLTDDKQAKLKRKMLLKILKKCSVKKKLVIIEDGGIFVPILHNERELKKYSKYCLGAVEQTTRGIRNDEKIKQNDLAFPIISVAKSVLKNELESPEVAQTIAQNIKYVTDHNEIHWQTINTNVLVIGGGSIGKNAAERLNHLGFKVFIYDNNVVKRKELKRKWKKNNITVLDEFKNFDKYNVLIGLTGERTITRDVILECKHQAILASGSSETYEIDMKLIEKSIELPLVNNIKKFKDLPIIEYKLKNRRSIRVLCNGEPLNFSLSSGISKVAIEPVLMQLFWSAVYIARGTKSKPGITNFPQKIEAEIKKEFSYTQPK